MRYNFRRINLSNDAEIRNIAEIDSAIPSKFDSDFPNDEKIILEKIHYFKNAILADDFFELAVDPDENLLGFHIIKKVDQHNGITVGSIYSLWVDPKVRKRGIGTALKNAGVNWAKEMNLDHLFTWINPVNAASVTLNKKLGYEVVSYKMKLKLK